MSALLRFVVAAASPLRLFDTRFALLEKALDLPLTDHEVRMVRQAGSDVRLGAYYHWYLQKLVVARSIKGLKRERALALIKSIDHTDYSEFQQVIDSPTGVLIAIPHHAHYILSMTALAVHLGAYRKVKVFYGQPSTHKGNEIFDHLHRVLYADNDSAVEVIHDNRHGLAKAIKGLKNGEIVFMMPDAFQDEDLTMMVRFCGRLMGTMLGTAVLARKTGSWILPVVSRAHGIGLGFKTWAGKRIDHPLGSDSKLRPGQIKVADYGVTSRMFGQFEEQMAGELYLWQHVRHHMASGGQAELAVIGEIPALFDALAKSPALKGPSLTIDLR